MRIALVVNSLGRGGAEVQVVDLAVTLAARGHDVRVITLLPQADAAMAAQLDAAGVTQVSLGMRGKRDVALAVGRYVRAVAAFRPDVVHAHMFASILLARLGRVAVRRYRLIETAHTPHERGRLRYGLYRSTAVLGGAWTCVCQEGIDTHRRAGAVRQAQLVRNGVRLEPSVPGSDERARVRAQLVIPEASPLWLSVGSFRDEQKDFGNLLAAFARVERELPEARLIIAGDGVLLEEKRRAAGDLGLGGRVRFLGLRTDVRALMAASDGFVLASRWEALPIVLLEAASSGLPIVTTDVGDVRSVVADDSLGRVVPARDPAALAAAMLDLSRATADERAAMGGRLRARAAAEFDLEVVVERWERAYRGQPFGDAAGPGAL